MIKVNGKKIVGIMDAAREYTRYDGVRGMRTEITLTEDGRVYARTLTGNSWNRLDDGEVDITPTSDSMYRAYSTCPFAATQLPIVCIAIRREIERVLG